MLDEYAKKTRVHDKKLAQNLSNSFELDESAYRQEHMTLKIEIEAFKKQFYEYKHEFFEFMTPVI